MLCSGLPVDGTMTIGNTILTRLPHDEFADRPGLVAHEISHSTQSATLGNDVYVVVWAVGAAASYVTGNAPYGGGGCLSPIELTAAPGGGYERC
ncbi:hypothetical protein GCM10025870_32750 [Agromyces marinus]|uniref:DUF4157 domain-containing protein n=1 Tax=Agromyces marinus TaxID=1389020 RepID=A0ABN6YFG6_9MICO|nr:hypothetical protein GCM10025870_32750 [Agromyces marinus]